MSKIFTKPFGVILKEDKSEFQYPFQELNSKIKQFEYQPLTDRLMLDLKMCIESFCHHLYNKTGLPESDRCHFHIRFENEGDNSLRISPTNIFSACILFGYNVPKVLLKNFQTLYELPNGSAVVFIDDTWTLVLDSEQNVEIK